MWKIIIGLPSDRYTEGTLSFWYYSESREKYIKKFTVACLGRGTTNPSSSTSWTQVNGNTPTGMWNGSLISPLGSSPDDSYGPNSIVSLTSISGNAYTAEHTYGRSGFMIHGGRANLEPPLYETHGCIRLYNSDMASLVSAIQTYGGGSCAVNIGEI